MCITVEGRYLRVRFPTEFYDDQVEKDFRLLAPNPNVALEEEVLKKRTTLLTDQTGGRVNKAEDVDRWQVIDRKAMTVGDLLDKLDFPDSVFYIGKAPVAIFGYSQMIRGDSFRGNYRVPTHMVQQLNR